MLRAALKAYGGAHAARAKEKMRAEAQRGGRLRRHMRASE